MAKLAKPVDFGPAPASTPAAARAAAAKWSEWWARREAQPGRLGGSALATDSTAPEARRLADALLTAAPQRRAGLVEKYRATKGVEYTEALALAIARSPAAARADLREALATRMVRMTAATLGRYLDDPLPRTRGAAALGIGKRGKTAHGARLAELLLDPDPLVHRAAGAALRELTGEDFGPGIAANEPERAQAAARWQASLTEREKKGER